MNQKPSPSQVRKANALIPSADHRGAKLCTKKPARNEPSSQSAPPQNSTHAQRSEVTAKSATHASKPIAFPERRTRIGCPLGGHRAIPMPAYSGDGVRV